MKFLIFNILAVSFLLSSCSEKLQDDRLTVDLSDENPTETDYSQPELPKEFLGRFEPIDVSYDTNHVKVNTAEMKVTLLIKNHFTDTTGDFGTWEKQRTDMPEFDFGESLLWDSNVTQIRNVLFFSGTVCLTDSAAYYDNLNGLYGRDRDTIPTYEFQNYHDGATINYEIGQLGVYPMGMQCMDTGKNGLGLKNDIGKVQFCELRNLKLFEFDLNQDGSKEIYVVSYATCAQFVSIYKIENSTS
ncbi:MAG: hypothetical protein ACI8ZM_000559 [Crocinitomix sp.]|jgi:hypothetical protein